MSTSGTDRTDSIEESLPEEVIVSKHSRLWLIVPVLCFCICIFCTVMQVGHRIVAGIWILFLPIFYVFCIERRPLYYFGVSARGIAQYNLLTGKKRQIPWHQVQQVGIRRDARTGGMLVITILGAPKWSPKRKHQDQTWYYLSNRPNVLLLEKWHPAQDLILKYYGALDY